MSSKGWVLRGCPRCGGDAFIDRDEEGWYQSCLQCGNRRELEPTVLGLTSPRGAYPRRKGREVKL